MEESSCGNPAFGLEGYQSCRAPQHGVERYNTCRDPSFGIEQFRTCSFYKTPEELDAYISETRSALESYALLLPSRKSDLLSRLRQEQSFICLIDKYNGLVGYEDVADDLNKKFLLTFGYERKDSTEVCDGKPDAIKVTLINIDCDTLTRDALDALVKPSDVSNGAFTRFKKNCSLKLSYDILFDWFETKQEDIQKLIGDVVAQGNPATRQALMDLKRDIDNGVR